MAEQSGRQLSDYVAIVRRRLWLIALVTAVTVSAAGVYTFNQPTVYRSSMKIVVGQGGGIVPSQIGSSAQQLTQTLSDLLQSGIVSRTVIADLHLHMKPPELLSHLHVITKPDTSVLQVLYDDQSAAASTTILSEVGTVFTGLVASRLVPKGPDGKPLDPTTALSARLFDPAHLLPGDVQPTPKKNLAVAFMVGLMLGLLAALVREQFDDTLRGVPQAEESFGQAATATLREKLVGYRPFEARQANRRVDPVVADLAMERLRASILWSPESREARTLLVTSASPQDGKTTVAANLSISLAKEGHDVIVVDSDLRRPALHRYMSVRVGADTLSLDDVIRGEAPLADALVEVPLTPLSGAWVTMGPAGFNGAPASRGSGRLRALLAASGHTWPSEVGVQRSLEILEQLRGMADYVIIDAAPILVVADAYAFVAAVDTVIAVVRVGRTTSAAVEGMSRTLERIRGRRRLELVVTGAESAFAGEYYDYRPKARSDRRTAGPQDLLSRSPGDRGPGSAG